MITMTYGSPQQSGKASYSGELIVNLAETHGFDGQLVARFNFGFEQAAELYGSGIEDVLDANFQDFVDYIAAYSGFSVPSGTDYTTLGTPEVNASKSYSTAEDVTPDA